MCYTDVTLAIKAGSLHVSKFLRGRCNVKIHSPVKPAPLCVVTAQINEAKSQIILCPLSHFCTNRFRKWKQSSYFHFQWQYSAETLLRGARCCQFWVTEIQAIEFFHITLTNNAYCAGRKPNLHTSAKGTGSTPMIWNSLERCRLFWGFVFLLAVSVNSCIILLPHKEIKLRNRYFRYTAEK